jgi:hypothetical protein
VRVYSVGRERARTAYEQREHACTVDGDTLSCGRIAPHSSRDPLVDAFGGHVELNCKRDEYGHAEARAHVRVDTKNVTHRHPRSHTRRWAS